MDEGEDENGSLPSPTQEAKENLAEIERELFLTRKLREESLSIKENTKADSLRRLLDQIHKENPDEKVVIFTQFKSTLADIERMFPDKKITGFHGSLSREEKDAAILDFKNRTQVLVSTEAGGEGRNLQFSRILINYDLPWNPFRIEQRIGRIHRFGQKFDVQIYNFAMEASIGERILEILSEKIKIFEDAFGETEALLGMVDGGGKTIEKLFTRLAMEARTGDSSGTTKAIQEHLKASKEKMDKLAGSLAISGQYLQEKSVTPGEIKKEIRRLAFKLETFFEDYARVFPEDVRILEIKGETGKRLFRIESPGALVETAWVSFDFELAEEGIGYLHLEHALVKRMLKKCLGQSLELAVSFAGKKRPADKIHFSFVLGFDGIDREERSLTITLDWDGRLESLDRLHRSAREKALDILESEKKDLQKMSARLVEGELEKIEQSSEKQVRELEEVLATYELRNKQSGGDNYFLLIPKVKKHLASLKREREAIADLTRDKREVRTDLYLFSLCAE